ncbi:MAG: glycosyltransferase family 1 protein [Candidatus Parvarchaeota archaeon]
MISKKINEKDRDEMLGDLCVFIVNRYPPLTSIYRWTEDLALSINNAEWINLLFYPEGWEHPHKGIDFRSRFIGNSTLTHTFRNFSFRAAVNYIKSKKEGRRMLIHYTNQFSGTFNFEDETEIVSVHDSPNYFESSSVRSKIFMHHLYSSIKDKEFITTNTAVLARELKEYGFTGQITTIHLSYSPTFQKLDEKKEDIRGRLGLPLDKKLVLSVSTNSPRKNLLTVARVIRLLGEEFRLVRVGSQLEGSITFERVNDEKLNEIYNACDVLLFPSLYEGFGLPIVEAFATGLPVVTSDIPTIREVAGDAAILVDPYDIDSISTGVREAVNNEQIAERGMNRAKEFTRTKFSERISSFYQSILKS